jgi:hypothetical protein
VSATSTGLRLHLTCCAAPASITLPTTGYSLSPPRPRGTRLWWSRPMHPHVCSLFARMPRHGPAPPGIRSEARMQATGQNDSSRHVLASFDSSSRRINEQSSGLLIRRFGVQVPGGAPVLTWVSIAPGCCFRVRFVPTFAPCLLAGTDPAIRVLSKTARPAPDAGAIAPEPRRLVRLVPPQGR